MEDLYLCIDVYTSGIWIKLRNSNMDQIREIYSENDYPKLKIFNKVQLSEGVFAASNLLDLINREYTIEELKKDKSWNDALESTRSFR
ncbi:MAG: hypothetical protein FD163_791 [Hyphomonadaceae bacterium]|nr:MAG: hypothetical protein FD128_1453 [Hyphomonadaceae bacterium]KAF0186123.1 MAG: hypothetical protein FD163_791 [Hyphomonadaceae bacterium]